MDRVLPPLSGLPAVFYWCPSTPAVRQTQYLSTAFWTLGLCYWLDFFFESTSVFQLACYAVFKRD